MDLQSVADVAGAGDEVRRYLKIRGISSAGTLSMKAPDETIYREVVAAPLLAGFGSCIRYPPVCEKARDRCSHASRRPRFDSFGERRGSS